MWFTLAMSSCLGQDADPYARFLARTEPLSPDMQLAKFRLPGGFKIELVAAEPLVRKPINLAFDAEGRLLVTGSVEYPEAASPGRTPRDVIKLLVDTDGDGSLDPEASTSFAAGLDIPIGITDGPRGVISYSIPNVDRFVDTDGDGRADRRDTLVRGFGFSDTHGMASSFTWWVDGWIYACHGETNESSLVGSDGSGLKLRGGSTFRMQPDGSRLERFTQGQANPFGLCFDPRGDLYSADSHSKPANLLIRGAWYPGIGNVHDGLGFAPPIMQHYHGSTGIAGIAYYADDKFPHPYRDSLFIGNPVTGRINHNVLTYHGSTCQAVEQPDFLTCDDPWFRPVDVKLGPDGALYIADFYDRVIGHTVVPSQHVQRDRERGRIWRIVFEGASNHQRRPIPDLTAVSAPELLKYLAHPNLVVRTQATHQIVARLGRPAREPLVRLLTAPRADFRDTGANTATAASEDWQRVHALWALARLNSLEGSLIERLAADADPRVRLHCVKMLADTPAWQAEFRDVRRIVLATLNDPDPFVRRAAAEALGLHPDETQVAPLLALWAETPPGDALLIHAIRIALRNTLRAHGDVRKLGRPFSGQRDARRRLADVALGIRSSDSAAFVLEHLQTDEYEPHRLGEYLGHAARFADAESLPGVHDFARSFRESDGTVQRRVLTTLFQSNRQRNLEIPTDLRDWAVRQARTLLSSDDEFEVQEGIELAWEAGLTELSPALESLADRKSRFPDLRSFAIDALASIVPGRAMVLLDERLRDATENIDVKDKAAEALGRIHAPKARDMLRSHLESAPSRLALTISRQLAHSREGGELLLDAVASGKASPRLLHDLVVDQSLRTAKIPELDRRLELLRHGSPAEDSEIARLLAERRERFLAAQVNAEAGLKVFDRHCRNCHQVRGKGDPVGPALDGIGARGVDRLTEDLLEPSRNVEAQYRQTVLTTKDGRVLTGLALPGENQAVMLVSGDGKRHSISSDMLASRTSTPLSTMPANLAASLDEADFYHLLGYLLTLQPEKSP